MKNCRKFYSNAVTIIRATVITVARMDFSCGIIG